MSPKRWWAKRLPKHTPPWRYPDLGKMQHLGLTESDRRAVWRLVEQAWANGWNDAVQAWIEQTSAELAHQRKLLGYIEED